MKNYENTTAHTFAIGDGATEIMYSDRKAGTIIAISKNGKKVTFQRDVATRLTKPEFIPGGFAGHCTNNDAIEYSYAPDPDGYTTTYSLRTLYASGGYIITKAKYDPSNPVHTFRQRWVRVGESARGGQSLSEGRHEHYDYNF